MRCQQKYSVSFGVSDKCQIIIIVTILLFLCTGWLVIIASYGLTEWIGFSFVLPSSFAHKNDLVEKQFVAILLFRISSSKIIVVVIEEYSWRNSIYSLRDSLSMKGSLISMSAGSERKRGFWTCSCRRDDVNWLGFTCSSLCSRKITRYSYP